MSAYTDCPEVETPVLSSADPELLARRSPHAAMLRVGAEALFGADELAAALDGGEVVELWPGVVVPANRQYDAVTRAAGALLRAGPHAVLSGPTAAAMHGCTAAADPVIEVTVAYDRQLRSLPGLTVRQAWIRESDVLELDGLRVFALDAVLAELLCTGPQRLALACVEEALGEPGPGRAEHLSALIAERIARRRDRRGTRKAMALLDLAWDHPQYPPVAIPSAGGVR